MKTKTKCTLLRDQRLVNVSGTLENVERAKERLHQFFSAFHTATVTENAMPGSVSCLGLQECQRYDGTLCGMRTTFWDALRNAVDPSGRPELSATLFCKLSPICAGEAEPGAHGRGGDDVRALHPPAALDRARRRGGRHLRAQGHEADPAHCAGRARPSGSVPSVLPRAQYVLVSLCGVLACVLGFSGLVSGPLRRVHDNWSISPSRPIGGEAGPRRF